MVANILTAHNVLFVHLWCRYDIAKLIGSEYVHFIKKANLNGIVNKGFYSIYVYPSGRVGAAVWLVGHKYSHATGQAMTHLAETGIHKALLNLQVGL